MERPAEDLRQCPTRADGAEALIAQTIQKGTCRDRQRRLYHKCWTCVHRDGAPALPTAAPAPVYGLPPKRAEAG